MAYDQGEQIKVKISIESTLDTNLLQEKIANVSLLNLKL